MKQFRLGFFWSIENASKVFCVNSAEKRTHVHFFMHAQKSEKKYYHNR